MHEQEVRLATFCHGQEKGVTVRNILSDGLIREIVLSPIWPHGEAKAVQLFCANTRGRIYRSFEALTCSDGRRRTTKPTSDSKSFSANSANIPRKVFLSSFGNYKACHAAGPGDFMTSCTRLDRSAVP